MRRSSAPQLATLGWALRRAALWLLMLFAMVVVGAWLFYASIDPDEAAAGPPAPAKPPRSDERCNSACIRHGTITQLEAAVWPGRGIAPITAPLAGMARRELDYQTAMPLGRRADGACTRAVAARRESDMKLVMLARNPSLYSHRRIVEAARARGHEIDVINTLHVHMNITSSRPTLLARRAHAAALRRRDPAHRRLDHALRPGRAAPVRGAGRVPAERERGHRPLARQAARAAAAGARGHRPAGDGLRARTRAAPRT